MAALIGKIALVTGAASGLGEATAAALAAAGAQVFMADINREQGEAAAAKIGERAEFVELDVAKEEGWKNVTDVIVERFGGLDILVNNAGVVVVATIEDTTAEQLHRIRSVNFDGPFFGCKHCIPIMAESGGGSIVNISSMAALIGTPSYAAYSMTKGALKSLTQTVAVHCKALGNGVRCNGVHPGAIETPMVENLAAGASPLALQMAATARAPGQLGQPQDVAAAVLYLVSDDASFVNGAAITVDDGMSVGGFGLA
jgi:3(or 17)beta-hydroxysteroid dehydrogenase